MLWPSCIIVYHVSCIIIIAIIIVKVFFIIICSISQSHHITHRYHHCIPFEESIPHIFSSSFLILWSINIVFLDYLLLTVTILQFANLCIFHSICNACTIQCNTSQVTFAPQEVHRTLWCRQSCQSCGGDEACCSVPRPLITIWLGDLHICIICIQAAFPYPCLKFGSECMLIHGIIPGWQFRGVNYPPLDVKLWIKTFSDFEFYVRYMWQAKRLRNGNALFQTPQDYPKPAKCFMKIWLVHQ